MPKKNQITQADKHYGMFAKSNILTLGSYETTLIESKIMAISLYYAKEMVITENDRNITVLRSSIPSSILKSMLGYKNTGNLYRDLGKAALDMMGKIIGYSDPANQKFHFTTLITDARFDENYFQIDYNYSFKNQLMDLKTNFTQFDLAMILGFKSVYGYRLYEMLKSHYNRSRWIKGDADESFSTVVSLSYAELLFKLGMVHTENKTIKMMLMKPGVPDYGKAVAMTPQSKIKYNTWYDFSRYVLNPAIQEINEKTEFNVQFTKTRKDRGGKTDDVMFKIELKLEHKKESKTSLDDIAKLIPFTCTEEELSKIRKASGGDKNKIKKAVDVYYEQSHNIVNPVPWLIKAIKNEYDTNFKQVMLANDMDLSELEDLLLEK